MFELRWFTYDDSDEDELQYRTQTLKRNNWGEIIGVAEWSEWEAVPYVHERDNDRNNDRLIKRLQDLANQPGPHKP